MKCQDPIYDALHNYTKALSVALGYRDWQTRLHSERVRALSKEIGLACGLTSAELSILKIAASFHDIGKIGVPDHILMKPTELDEQEWVFMKRHPEIGAKIIASIEIEGAQQAAQAILHHHESFDGEGYPHGIAGEAIPICARIISVADSYDAISVRRSYHDPRPHPEVMEIMRMESSARCKHDPEVMKCFIRVIESGRLDSRES